MFKSLMTNLYNDSMTEKRDSLQYESVRALVRQLHGPTKNVSRPHTDDEASDVETTEHSPPIFVATNPRKKSYFEHALKIPALTVTGPQSPENMDNPLRRFSFGLRRHSHSTGLNRVESMGTLSHRTLLQYLDADDLNGLKSFLDTRQLQIDDRDENGTTVLMLAAGRGNTHFARELIARGSDVNSTDLDSWTALLCATKGGHLEVVEMLVEHGADIEHREMGNWSALMWAAYRGYTEIVAFLLDHNADVHANGNYHLGSLLWACGRGYTEIVSLLVSRGAKVNVGDKYGTSPLVWACRKGNAEIVDTLLKAGANIDNAGMYSWTALLVAVSGGHQECVALLLERKPNVNALDKDGATSLSIACREGLQEIASALIASGAYVNIQDRAGDTPLINAVKAGHRGIVEALLKRHADIDIQGKDKKTALYMAVEKGHVAIVKILLSANPDIELATKDGDTPLHRAVRNRHLEIVQTLLEKRAKVNAVDRRGDTCLHIAMRARSKAIVEALLRNPKNSQLLYRANKAGETPYGLDALHQKTILGQVFGARKLNTNEDSEGMLGYELYSAALADVLSEPTLTCPITVGLYAKWGSGKSFLLNKLREEMQSFARAWAEPPIKAHWLTSLICFHLALIVGVTVGLSTWSLWLGVTTAISILVLVYSLSLSLRFFNKRYDMDWSYNLHHMIRKKVGKLRLILLVAFCHPGGPQSNNQAMPVRFHFAESNNAAATGENAVGHMLANLFDAIENYYGSLPTRLYRAFRPKPMSSSGWRFRRMCCMPIVVLFELGIIGAIGGISLLVMFYGHPNDDFNSQSIQVSLYVLGAILLAGVLANLHAWAKAMNSLFFSQGRYLKQIIKSNEGGLAALGSEVMLMADMVKCLDSFTCQQSRLVGVVDTLDSCDTERTLSVLNAIQTLLMTPNRPFVLLLAVDPHVVAKAAEANSKRLFTEGGIGGHDFLRNLVHLPVYLQNSGLRKVQRAQSTAQNTAASSKRIFPEHQFEEGVVQTLGHSVSARRLSNASEIMASNEKLRAPPTSRPGSKKLRLSESIASSIGSNMHKLSGNQTVEFSKIMLTDDYFSDVNPRSIRRLMNVIYITVRLLKAFQIDFSWYRLSSWINLTEQWPLRASMIVLEHDLSGDNIDDNCSLQSLYDKVRPKLTSLREAATLLDLDRDERKLDAFLQLHKSDLQVSDLRIFLPFTINLDPYLRKVLKEDQQAMEDEGIIIPIKPLNTLPMMNGFNRTPNNYFQQQYPPTHPIYNPTISNSPIAMMNYYNTHNQQQHQQQHQNHQQNAEIIHQQQPKASHQQFDTSMLQQHIGMDVDLSQVKLSKLNCDELISLLMQINELKLTIEKLAPILRDNAITGRVLLYCELNELKSVLMLNFGHWEIFKLLVMSLRNLENNPKSSVSFRVDNKDSSDGHQINVQQQQQQSNQPRLKQKSIIEKQVTLEEQFICGALQTLNEDAFEDVAVGSERPSPNGSTGLTNSPVAQKRNSILKHSNSINKQDKSSKKVSIEHVNEKSKSKTLVRPPSLLKIDRPLFHMGASFEEEKSEDEFEIKGTSRKNSSKNMLDENIPLVNK